MTGALEGTAALVTGASSGIGEATARALCEQGAAVAAVARRGERLDRLAAEVAERGGRVLPIEADVTDAVQAREAVARAARELGRLDIVVNNAGLMLLAPVLDAPLDEWERMIAINLQGLLYVTHAALPHLIRAAQGAPRRVADVVNLSSVAGRKTRKGNAVYSMTKFGVVAFGEGLRQEMIGQHVRVCALEPGAVATELASHMTPEAREQSMQAFQHIEQLRAEDIADAIVYVVTRPRHVAINEVLIRPAEQEG